MRKLLLITAGVLAGLLILLFVGLKLYLTDERLRAMVEPAMESALARDVSIGGFELRLLRSFPNITVGATEVAVHTPARDNEPQPDLASLDALWIKLPILPLLQSKVHITALELEKPRVLVEYYEDGTSNLPAFASEGEEEAGVVKEIAIASFNIVDGQIAYSHADGTLLVIEGMETTLSAALRDLAAVTGDVSIASFYFETGGITYADGWPVVANVDATANLDSSWVTLANTALQIDALELDLQGDIQDWDKEAIGIDLEVDAPNATIEGIWSLMPAALVKDIAGLRGTGAVAVEASMNGVLSETELPETNIAIRIADGSLQYPGLPAAIQQINLDAVADLESLQIRTLSAIAAGALLNLSGSLQQYANPVVNMAGKLQADLESLQQFYPLEENTQLAGKLDIDASLQGAVAKPAEMNASGQVLLEAIQYNSTALQQPVSDLNGQLVLAGNTLSAQAVSLTSGKSDFTFTGALQNYTSFLADPSEGVPAPVITGTLNSRYLDISEQLSDDTTAAGPIELPGVIADVAFNVEEVAYGGLSLSDAGGKLGLVDGVITFEGASAGFLDGILQAAGSFDLSDPLAPVFDGTLGLNQVRASRFFTAFNQLDQIARLGSFLDGFFDSEASIGLKMDQDLNPQLESLFAEGTFGATGGALKGMPIQEKLASLTGLQALTDLDVGAWTHKFNISGEKMHVQALNFGAGAFNFGVNGSQGFDGSIDYQLRVELPASAQETLSNAPLQQALQPLSQLAQVALVDPATNRITLDFDAGGSFASPELSLDNELLRSRLDARASALADGARSEAQARLDSLESAAKMKAEAELAEQKRLLEEKAAEEAKKLLSGVVDSSAISTDLDSLKEKGGEVLKDRLKGLLGRKKKKN
ncbi:MAG: AsmA-like C-terminal region-containing protein [Bacteroidota bacterium]